MSDKNRNYEGLFLFPQAAMTDLQAAQDHVMDLLKRIGAEIISFCKWDERRLAYEIKGNKRGVYFLAFFKADPTRVPRLERDCNLSEHLLRTLVVRADNVPDEHMQAIEGRATLADEIKLRKTEAAEQPVETAAAAASDD
jgi:small subunit ribosomal protein S6